MLRDIYHDRGQFTQDRVQRTGDKLQRRETVYRGHDTRNRDVRHGTKGGYIRQRIQFSLHFIRRKPGRWRKTKENAIVVGKPQRGKKPDVKIAPNLQSLAARFYSMTANDYIGRLTHVVGDEFLVSFFLI